MVLYMKLIQFYSSMDVIGMDVLNAINQMILIMIENARGELNNKTIEISNKIKNAGYNLIEMYECEWEKILNSAREK